MLKDFIIMFPCIVVGILLMSLVIWVMTKISDKTEKLIEKVIKRKISIRESFIIYIVALSFWLSLAWSLSNSLMK